MNQAMQRPDGNLRSELGQTVALVLAVLMAGLGL
jgi:hypothetical protein